MSGRTTTSLHLDAGREFRGGQRQVLYLLQGLLKRGHSVLLCCPRAGQLFSRARAAGIPCEALTIRSSLDFPSAVRLARMLRDDDFDLVHAHDSHSHSIARAAQGISHEPALTANLFVTRRNLGQDRGALGRMKYARPGVHYIAISKQVRDGLLRQGVAVEQIAVVPSGVEVDSLSKVRTEMKDDPWELHTRGLRVIGTVGYFTREKNLALLLQAFARLRRMMPETHLLLVGDGPLRKNLMRKAADLSLDEHVTFAGHLDDVRPAFAAFDVFALSSDAEGLCSSMLDAMSAGVPVATTAAGGVLSIARHGTSALVVPPRDAEALAGAILRLLQQPDLATRLIEGARKVANEHSTDRMVERTLEVYENMGHFLTSSENQSTP